MLISATRSTSCTPLNNTTCSTTEGSLTTNNKYVYSFSTSVRRDDSTLLTDNFAGISLIDTRNTNKNQHNSLVMDDDYEDLPTKITGVYRDDYNIIYIDDVVGKKLRREQQMYLRCLRDKLQGLHDLTKYPQTYIQRTVTLDKIKKTEDEIKEIESGERIRKYKSLTKDIISGYKRSNSQI